MRDYDRGAGTRDEINGMGRVEQDCRDFKEACEFQ